MQGLYCFYWEKKVAPSCKQIESHQHSNHRTLTLLGDNLHENRRSHSLRTHAHSVKRAGKKDIETITKETPIEIKYIQSYLASIAR